MAMVKTGGSKRASISLGQDVKKLTDLMERFHTLSGLYETKRKAKRGKSHQNESPKNQASSNDTVLVIPKPIPPLANSNSKKKSGRKKSMPNVKPITNDLDKARDTYKAKLHKGAGIGVKVFRLKDSLVEENVLQSFPQEDIKYSFHQPSFPLKSEGSLYREALLSSRKYNNTNRGRQLSFHRGKNGSEIANELRLSLNNKVPPISNDFIAKSEKANTIADFDFDRKKQHKQNSFHEQYIKPSRYSRSGNVIFTKDQFDAVVNLGTQEEKDKISNILHSEKSYIQKPKNTLKSLEIGKKSVGEKQSPPVMHKRHKHIQRRASLAVSPPTATLVDMSPRHLAEDEDNMHGTPGTNNQNVDKIRIPKFVRSNEEVEGHNFVLSESTDATPELLSASGYYTSTYPKFSGKPPLILKKEALKSAKGIHQTHEIDLYNRIASPNNYFLTPPPPTPVSRLPSAKKDAVETDLTNQTSFAGIKKAYASPGIIRSHNKTHDIPRHRRPLPMKQKRLKKVENDETNLETLIQSRSLVIINDEKDLTKAEKMSNFKEIDDISGSLPKNSSQEPVFNARESFIIKSKNSVTEPNITKDNEIHKPTGKLAPLIKLNREMRKSKFILARTSGYVSEDLTRKSPVHLVSDPVTFSVRHPAYSSYMPVVRERDEQSQNGEEMKSKIPDENPEKNDQNETSKDNQTMVVFFHHVPATSAPKNGLMRHRHDNNNTSNDNFDVNSGEKSSKKQPTNVEDISPEREDKIEPKIEKRIRQSLDKVALKTTGGGGFKSNAAHYSLLFRQNPQLKQDRDTFLRLVQEDFLKTQTPELGSLHVPTKRKSLNSVTNSNVDAAKPDETKISKIMHKYSSADASNNSESQKVTSYTMFSSRYPVKHEDAIKNKKQDPDRISKKARELSIKMHYVWPNSQRTIFPLGQHSRPFNSLKSQSSNSDNSSVKSLSIKDLNFDLKTNQKGNFISHLGRASIPNKFHEYMILPDSEEPPQRRRPKFAIFSLPEVQNTEIFDGKDQRENLSRQLAEYEKELDSALFIDAHSAAILPDPGTSSYRMTHDVSFDEGSRYRTNEYPHNFKGKDDIRIHPNYNGLMGQFGSRTNDAHAPASHNRQHEGRIAVSKEHIANHSNNNNNISFKESVPLSLIRMDERFAAELPPASPSSPAMSSAIAAATSSSFIPPPSASRQNPHLTSSTGSNITFRLHKEKHNWNYRLGELSINGGGLYTSAAVNSSARPDLDSMSLNMSTVNATSQRNSLTRERVTVPPKSRMSSRYPSKGDSANAAASFSDPCISAPPSFQQRLTDLSLLESDTIKYERNRKLRRKKNQDKDS